MLQTPPGDPEHPIGGWLIVLSGYLAVWQPLAFVIVATEAVAALPIRGWRLGALLALKLAITAIGPAAVLAMSGRRPAGLALARSALALSAAMDLLVYSTSIFPNNRLPGTTPFYIGWSLLVHGSWLLYLQRSARVRRTFP